MTRRVPLRVTLVVALLVLAAVGLTVTGAVVTASIRGYLVGQVDEDLLQLVDRRIGDGGLGGPGRPNPFDTSRDEYIGVAGPGGRVLQQGTTNFAEPPDLDRADLTAASAGPFTVPSTGSGADWRVVVRSGTFAGQPVLLVRGVSLREVTDTTRRLVLLETLVGAGVLALLALLAYVVVRSSLRPLEEVEATAAEIAAGDLTRRVPEGDERTEVGRLSRAVNAMLGQIEAAFRARERSERAAVASEERMRRFVADAGHELRTPLTSIRGFAELYRQGAVTDPQELDRVMRRVEEEAARMALLVEDLLLLARLDQQRPLESAPVDLAELARDAVRDARLLAPDREITLDASAGSTVLGDEGRLRQVVTNLLSNALTHTPDGTPVAVSVAAAPGSDGAPGTVRLTVADRGPGLAPEDRSRVFERFYRVDRSRSRAAGGNGLGLSIVAALVAAHGGRVGVDSAPGHGSRFMVDLPRRESPGRSQDGHRSAADSGPDRPTPNPEVTP
jgi:two-component system OmpR family sensor kinase